MAKKKKEIIHWVHNKKVIDCLEKLPEGCLGIIYKITNLTNKKYYYGRKTIVSNRKKKLTKKERLLPENGRKTFKREACETSGWQKYCGSNKPLLADIKAGDRYEKEIIQFCFSKAEMTFYETRAIVCSDCLFTEDCYNDWVSGRIYRKHLIGSKS